MLCEFLYLLRGCVENKQLVRLPDFFQKVPAFLVDVCVNFEALFLALLVFHCVCLANFVVVHIRTYFACACC